MNQTEFNFFWIGLNIGAVAFALYLNVPIAAICGFIAIGCSLAGIVAEKRSR